MIALQPEELATLLDTLLHRTLLHRPNDPPASHNLDLLAFRAFIEVLAEKVDEVHAEKIGPSHSDQQEHQ
ncbi:MAG: hypothetical protein ACRDQH_19075 [Pseudonocardiaceae bacterium]